MDNFILHIKILAACFLIFLSFGLVGARVAKALPQGQLAKEYHPLFGWAGAIILMLCFAPWMSGGGMVSFLILLCIASYLMLRSHTSVMQSLPLPFLVGALLLVPLLYGFCEYQIREWDDFSHWLPNAHFLFQYGRFPANNGPLHYSAWPAYPYGLGLLIASTGWIVGQFVDTACPLINILLIALFGSFLARHLNPEASTAWQKLRFFAAILFGITAANPGFNEFLVLSSYADHATAIILGFLLFSGADIIKHLSVKDNCRAHAICFALLAIVFVQIKQANIYLLLLLSGSLWLTANGNKKQLLKILGLALLPAILVQGYWEFYKAQHLPGLSFSFKPLDKWQLDLLLPLFQAMGDVAMHKLGYFALLIFLTLWGGKALLKKNDGTVRLAASFCLLALGYFLFLTLAYLGSSFSEWEIRQAASFFRYMSHLQFAAMGIALFVLVPYLRERMRNFYPALRVAGALLVILIPCAGLAITILQPLSTPPAFILDAQNYARAIFPKLPPNAKILLIGTESDGLEMPMFRYEWALAADLQHHPEITERITRYDERHSPEAIKAYAERFDAVIVTPHDGLGFLALNQPFENNWVSFVRKDQNWVKVLP